MQRMRRFLALGKIHNKQELYIQKIEMFEGNQTCSSA